MKGNGDSGRRLCLSQRGRVPYSKYCKTARKFTLIGWASFDGQPVMCVLIIQGIQDNTAAEV